MEQVVRIELTSTAWKAVIIAVILYLHIGVGRHPRTILYTESAIRRLHSNKMC